MRNIITDKNFSIAYFKSKIFPIILLSYLVPACYGEEVPDSNVFGGNVGVVNNYVFRGITQTLFKPAIQGGFDYSHESGFYAGNWNSSITWIADVYGQNIFVGGKSGLSKPVSAPVEMDFYAGLKRDWIAKGFVSDLGVATYYYPSSGIPNTAGYYANPNTTE